MESKNVLKKKPSTEMRKKNCLFCTCRHSQNLTFRTKFGSKGADIFKDLPPEELEKLA